ncbi:DUF1501 domain-containing protein [Singulisphaera sp. PoT]|uniref:DUF1501 domain-containing protein n=1 Tax=Singulisphaera sp. PoT TaxID=3411797 RepID=UPI003BF4882D
MPHPDARNDVANAGIIDRRGLLSWGLRGLGATALLDLLARDGAVKAAEAGSLTLAGNLPAGPHFLPKAKRAVQISLVGGMSHLDSFDYKPALIRSHGKTLQTDQKPDLFFGQMGRLRQSDWAFKQRGSSGIYVSDLFPHIAEMADELTVIRSMTCESANHTPALFVANSGFQFNGFPALGSWLSYGLGNEVDDLPSFVVLADPRGAPNGAASNWTNGFLPSVHQGVVLRGGNEPVRDLFPGRPISADEEEAARAFLKQLNSEHLEGSGGDSGLEARLKTYELAAKMQLAVPRASKLEDEPAKIREMYGLDRAETSGCARQCLTARRLLERGVRFVQIYSGGPIAGTPRTSWDAHEDVKDNHGTEALRIDQPVAALLRDLRQRGMLEDTLVLFTTEFGRTPFTQSAADTVGAGRDHNKYAFSCWLAGAGLKSGQAFGETDEVGWKVVKDPVPWYDFHATVLHLLGLDHERLTYYHNGIARRLTNVHGEVIRGILA